MCACVGGECGWWGYGPLDGGKCFSLFILPLKCTVIFRDRRTFLKQISASPNLECIFLHRLGPSA